MQDAVTLERGSAAGESTRALTPKQREKWERDGYLILPQFFGADVIDPVNALIERLSSPGARSAALARRVVVDLLAGAAQSQRMRLADAPDEAFRRPIKFNDLTLECGEIRNCNLNPRLVPILDELLDGPPVACNSLNFIQGSEQADHIDSWFMPPPGEDKMVVTSVCLEDVHSDAGPLFYFPGSHKIPPYRFSSGSIRALDGEMDKVHAYIDAEIAKRGLKREIFIGKKGDVFIWASQLAHGGSPINDPSRTRKSLVTHYWRANDMARHKLEGVNGGYYFAKDHQPVPSDPAWKRLADRAWLEARWAGRLVKRAVIPPAH
ncbi:MAG: phytanoyl-CoA dioxygenase family protein [Alphaproteobacteria bacterium]|nr:MAG: phytanoyl-CoA dioxygenase family protein [Alphaproteobacteria bacterium]